MRTRACFLSVTMANPLVGLSSRCGSAGKKLAGKGPLVFMYSSTHCNKLELPSKSGSAFNPAGLFSTKNQGSVYMISGFSRNIFLQKNEKTGRIKYTTINAVSNCVYCQPMAIYKDLQHKSVSRCSTFEYSDLVKVLNSSTFD